LGSKEFINGELKWCLWFDGFDLLEIQKIPPLVDRIYKVKESRENGGIIARNYVKIPHRFYSVNTAKSTQIIIPRVSSERRKYVPMGFLSNDYIISDRAQAIYDSEPFIFSVLNSKMHMVWFKTTAGRLKSDYNYSSALSYNTFPFPTISKQRKEELTQCTLRIIDERLKHSEKTLAQLYDPDKMPEGLKEAHHQNDLAVERCFRSTPFSSDEERLEYLFKLYEKMIQEEKDKDTLFAKQKKTRKRK